MTTKVDVPHPTDRGKEVVWMQNAKLSEAEMERYDRQMRIQGWGVKGQLKLRKAKVVVAGAGGLGCAAALYLAAAGVGHITIVDRERVELSNLNRQVLHWTADVGKFKGVSIAEKLRELNPQIRVEGVPREITQDNARRLIEGFDVVVDCLDNWQTRFALNDACIRLDVPLVHAGVHSWFGQIITIMPKKGPCLRCILPETPPEKERFPILGMTAGTLGLLEALEVCKLITGLGVPLVGRMLHLDLENMTVQQIKVEKRTDCPVCAI